jgi:hypothetical protein
MELIASSRDLNEAGGLYSPYGPLIQTVASA